jgi:hypothetical protein
MAKVSVLLRLYADLKKVIESDVCARDDLDRHGCLRSGATQGCRPWGVEVEIYLRDVKATTEQCK